MTIQPPVQDSPRENKFCPPNWDNERLMRASAQMSKFLDWEAYHWLANYLGVCQRNAERDMIPKQPHKVSHAEYIENATRVQDLSDVFHAITYLCSLKEKDDGSKG